MHYAICCCCYYKRQLRTSQLVAIGKQCGQAYFMGKSSSSNNELSKKTNTIFYLKKLVHQHLLDMPRSKICLSWHQMSYAFLFSWNRGPYPS
jgi:hypothetical protein